MAGELYCLHILLTSFHISVSAYPAVHFPLNPIQCTTSYHNTGKDKKETTKCTNVCLTYLQCLVEQFSITLLITSTLDLLLEISEPALHVS